MTLDPLEVTRERIKSLRQQLKETITERERLLEVRKHWPKIVRVSVSKGKWDEEVLEAFAETCGWTPTPHDGSGTNLGPINNGKFICAQAWLYYEAQEDGTLKLVGAEDQDFGKVGICPED